MAGARKRRILVLDDDSGILEMIREALVRAGYEVELAGTCDDGMRIFRKKRIDLAIVDIFMPDKDGLETLMEMRRSSKDAKVLAISGGGNIGFGQALALAEKLGAKATMAKPFTPDELVAKVAQLFKGSARENTKSDSST